MQRTSKSETATMLTGMMTVTVKRLRAKMMKTMQLQLERIKSLQAIKMTKRKRMEQTRMREKTWQIKLQTRF